MKKKKNELKQQIPYFFNALLLSHQRRASWGPVLEVGADHNKCNACHKNQNKNEKKKEKKKNNLRITKYKRKRSYSFCERVSKFQFQLTLLKFRPVHPSPIRPIPSPLPSRILFGLCLLLFAFFVWFACWALSGFYGATLRRFFVLFCF